MVFLGYAEGTKAYRLYDPREDKVPMTQTETRYLSHATSCSTRMRLGTRTVRAQGKLATSPAPSSSSTWSSMVVEMLGKRCRALREGC